VRYEGGRGGRDGSDLVRWTLEVTEDLLRVNTYDGSSRMFQQRPTTAELTLTLHDITKAESEAVVRVVNETRSASTNTVIMPSRGPTIGDRFSGLDLLGSQDRVSEIVGDPTTD
jgi:hypothetical protein